MRNKRQKKFRDFNKFYNTCEDLFKEFENNDKSSEFFRNNYILNIVPGSRHGGNDKRTVEVFYGSRPFDFINEGNRRWKTITEYGATLLYEQFDKGFVIISFYPAKTENLKQEEDFITYKFLTKPKKLLKKSYLKKHYRRLVAYMESTSIDGQPSLKQKLLVWSMKFFKPMVVNKQARKSKFRKYYSEILKYTLTVGLSGFLIFLITLYKDNSLKDEIKTSIQIQEKNSTLLDSINNNLKKLNKDSTSIKNGR